MLYTYLLQCYLYFELHSCLSQVLLMSDTICCTYCKSGRCSCCLHFSLHTCMLKALLTCPIYKRHTQLVFSMADHISTCTVLAHLCFCAWYAGNRVSIYLFLAEHADGTQATSHGSPAWHHHLISYCITKLHFSACQCTSRCLSDHANNVSCACLFLGLLSHLLLFLHACLRCLVLVLAGLCVC